MVGGVVVGYICLGVYIAGDIDIVWGDGSGGVCVVLGGGSYMVGGVVG